MRYAETQLLCGTIRLRRAIRMSWLQIEIVT
jgi:hypothetical protein